MGDNKERENKEIIISKDGKEKEVREEKQTIQANVIAIEWRCGEGGQTPISVPIQLQLNDSTQILLYLGEEIQYGLCRTMEIYLGWELLLVVKCGKCQ
ncbi:MAG: hypothetical protein EZS28_033230 [Streblomastix strix]|uniref:Uncharacterized protein n=1 Tax=Streblomastix strix TaxID=222440 RepID=A0A5J4ULT3_9EUKA|nr:MAG: hypothetical protein EZS28_033230 [Streblomastix strix]